MSQVSTQESRGEQSRAEREAEEAVKNMKRLAVLVGCNYTNSRHELRGCINDVQTMIDVLVSRFGFKTEHIELLTDDPGAPIMPTGANIRGALGRMIDKAEAGDVLFFHYSGHGTRIPSSKGHGSKQDEAIVPCDFNLITERLDVVHDYTWIGHFRLAWPIRNGLVLDNSVWPRSAYN